MRYDSIGLDQCPGDRTYNGFAGTDKCKPLTTECQPIPGFGFGRGGYECVCRLGFSYPAYQNKPFAGLDVEYAPDSIYSSPYYFNCIPSEQAPPVIPSQTKIDEIHTIFYLANKVSRESCSSPIEEVVIQSGLAKKLQYSVLIQYPSEIHIAWRLSLFLSNYLQNNAFPLTNGKTEAMPLLAEEVYGELLAIVLSHPSIKMIRSTFAENIFSPLQFFDSLVYRTDDAQVFLNATTSDYRNSPWWINLLKLTSPDTRPLSLNTAKLKIRSDPEGTSLKYLGQKTFKGTSRTDSLIFGDPFFSCTFNTALISFGIPFYAPSTKFPDRGVAFGGFVNLGLPLLNLNVDQCDTSNDEIFRGSHLCDRTTTECLPIDGNGFTPGGYKCFCKPGYVHPDAVEADYFVGEIVEREYAKLKRGESNYYDKLKCKKLI